MVDYIFSSREVVLQMAFDFYDCNNDELVSEYDLFRILKTYGKTDLWPNLQVDIIQML